MGNHIEHACATCPRRGEPYSSNRIDPRGKWAGAQGPISSPILIIGTAPGKTDLSKGEAFAGSAGHIVYAAFGLSGVSLDLCRIMNVINCFPIGAKESITKEQLTACRSRYEADVAKSDARIIVPMGKEALIAVTGFQKGAVVDGVKFDKKQGILDWRGYVIEPTDVIPPKVSAKCIGNVVLPPRTQVILPTLHPSYVRSTGFTRFPFLQSDLNRAARAVRTPLVLAEGQAKPTDFVRLAEMARDEIGIDVETAPNAAGDGWSNRIERMGVAVRGSNGDVYCASDTWDLRTRHQCKAMFADPTILNIMHNAFFDRARIQEDGLELAGEDWCTMTAQHVIYSDLEKSLNAVAPMYVDTKRWKHLRPDMLPPAPPRYRLRKNETEEELAKRINDAHQILLANWNAAYATREEGEETYNFHDVEYLHDIKRKQYQILHSTGALPFFRERMMKCVPDLIDLQRRGIRVDNKIRDRFYSHAQGLAASAYKVWQARIADNESLLSWQLVHRILYTDWRLPPQYKVSKGTKSITADRQALRRLLKERRVKKDRKISQAIRALIANRTWEKRVERLENIKDEVHPSYGPASVLSDDSEGGTKLTFSAATFRITCRDPSIHSWEKAGREIFIPWDDDNVFLAIDYIQQELYIQAFLAQDEALMEAVLSGDVHKFHQAEFFLDRTRAKNVVYGSIFRGGPRAIQSQCEARGFEISQREIKDIQLKIRRKYAATFAWQDEYLANVYAQKYAVNPFGLRRNFPSPDGVMNEIVNYPIQSIAACILWVIVPQIKAWLTANQGALTAPVHDEGLLEVRPANVFRTYHAIKQIMEQPFDQVSPGFSIPVDGKVGRNWGPETSRNPLGMQKYTPGQAVEILRIPEEHSLYVGDSYDRSA